jgi:hypothetical protein
MGVKITVNIWFKWLSEQWFYYVFNILGTIVTIWVGLTLSNSISRYVHLPFFLYQLKRNQNGHTLEVTSSLLESLGSNSDSLMQVDRGFYNLHGLYKSYGITSNIPRSIGTPNQFIPGIRFQATCLDQSILKCFDGVESKVIRKKIYLIIRFYRRQLRGTVDSDLLLAINLSLLSQLGADLPFEWKIGSYNYLKTVFISGLLDNGYVQKRDLYNLAYAESLLIQNGQKYNNIDRIKIQLESFLEDPQHERRDLKSGPCYEFLSSFDKAWKNLSQITQGE